MNTNIFEKSHIFKLIMFTLSALSFYILLIGESFIQNIVNFSLILICYIYIYIYRLKKHECIVGKIEIIQIILVFVAIFLKKVFVLGFSVYSIFISFLLLVLSLPFVKTLICTLNNDDDTNRPYGICLFDILVFIFFVIRITRMLGVFFFFDRNDVIVDIDTAIRFFVLINVTIKYIHLFFFKNDSSFKLITCFILLYIISLFTNYLYRNVDIMDLFEDIYLFIFYSFINYLFFSKKVIKDKTVVIILTRAVSYLFSMWFLIVFLELFFNLKGFIDITTNISYIFINTNYPGLIGSVLMAIIFLLLYFLSKEKNILIKILDFLFLIINISILMVINSRANYYGFILGSFICIFIYCYFKKDKSLIKSISLCILMVLFITLFRVLLVKYLNTNSRIILDACLDTTREYEMSSIDRVGSVNVRFDIYKKFIMSLFKNKDVLLFGVTKLNSAEYLHGLGLEAIHSHNEFFELILRNGIFVSLSFACVVICSAYKFIVNIRNSSSITIISFGFVLAVMFSYMFEASFLARLLPQSFMLFVALGILNNDYLYNK